MEQKPAVSEVVEKGLDIEKSEADEENEKETKVDKC